MQQLSKFFSKSNIGIVAALVDDALSVRDLAKHMGCSPAKITQFLKLFGASGLVSVRKEKNRKIVSLQRDNPLVKEFVSLIFINRIVGSKAFAALKKSAKSVGVYGSVAEGTVDKKSDIDLWAVVGKKMLLMKAGRLRLALSNELGREVSIRFLTKEDVQKLRREDSIFYSELDYKSKILSGEGFA